MNEKTTIKIIKNIMPAVVSIMVAKQLEDLEKDIPPDIYPLLPKKLDRKTGKKEIAIPEELVDERGMIQVGGGSGFIVEQSGIIITNKHVVSDADAEYTVITNDNEKRPARVISRDPLNDVAILKIEGGGFPIVRLGDALSLQLGESVIAIGNALGIFKNTVSSGIVSGLSRAIRAQADPKAPPQEMRGLVQTDAAINPGNSGGPLVNSKGCAVGINAALVSGAQNISFAIPINAARRDLEDVKRYGRIRRPFLGVRYIVLDERMKSKMDVPTDYGALVVPESPHDHGVVPGSPADRAGLKERDIILEVNGERIDTDHPIQDCLETLTVGDEIKMSVLRKGKHLDVSVTLSEKK